MKFSINDFFSKCDQIRRNLRIWSHLLNKFLMENFTFCAVILSIFLFLYIYNAWYKLFNASSFFMDIQKNFIKHLVKIMCRSKVVHKIKKSWTSDSSFRNKILILSILEQHYPVTVFGFYISVLRCNTNDTDKAMVKRNFCYPVRYFGPLYNSSLYCWNNKLEI